jgi:hypothetical protein
VLRVCEKSNQVLLGSVLIPRTLRLITVNREPMQQLCKPRQSLFMGSRFTELLYGFSVYRVVVWVLGLQGFVWVLCLQSCCMGSLFTELLYGFSVYRVVVWVLCLQSCCMGSLFTVLLYGFSVYRVVQLCKQRTHTTTL